ncbi:MAG: IS4 family transposase [Elusimicrobia bacterium]|nr:IS4 family transposase [Elusimicrobiota bacterium]
MEGPIMSHVVSLPSKVEAAPNTPINLLETVALLNKHLTEALCAEIFQSVRTTEREREWSLFALGRFWTAVALQTPSSTGQALDQAREGGNGLLPEVTATASAAFQRFKTLHWKFFHALYYAFTQRLMAEAQPVFAGPISGLRKRFPSIFLVDGSRLDPIAHKLKIVRNHAAAILPGCVSVIYDLFHGMTRQVLFDPDAAAPELHRAIPLLSSLPEGSLIVGDRLYASIQFFWELSRRKQWGLFRLNGVLKLDRQHLISRKQCGGRTVVEEWLVLVGSGQTAPEITLRLISLRQGDLQRDLLTNVLDPEMLRAEEALSLYPFRWKIERVFFDLKETLNLHKFYTANPNGVAMQLYATAMVYNAFRVAQGRIAQRHGITPEEISPAKFFPKLAQASSNLAGAEQALLGVQRLNPGVQLRLPNVLELPLGRTTLQAILVRERGPNRRRRYFVEGRKRWKSLAHVSGGQKLTKLT